MLTYNLSIDEISIKMSNLFSARSFSSVECVYEHKLLLFHKDHNA